MKSRPNSRIALDNFELHKLKLCDGLRMPPDYCRSGKQTGKFDVSAGHKTPINTVITPIPVYQTLRNTTTCYIYGDVILYEPNNVSFTHWTTFHVGRLTYRTTHFYEITLFNWNRPTKSQNQADVSKCLWNIANLRMKGREKIHQNKPMDSRRKLAFHEIL